MWRNGLEYKQAFEYGKPLGTLLSSQLPSDQIERTGTRVNFLPDKQGKSLFGLIYIGSKSRWLLGTLNMILFLNILSMCPMSLDTLLLLKIISNLATWKPDL